jgi:hypothetical protein
VLNINDSNSSHYSTNVLKPKGFGEKNVERVSRTLKDAIIQEFIDSGISQEVLDRNIEIVDDIEINPITKEVTATPIHNFLGWKFTRFTNKARPPMVAALFGNWQAKVFTHIQNGKRTGQYYAPAGIGDIPYLATIPNAIARKIAAKVSPLLESSLMEWFANGGLFWDWVIEHKEIPIIITEGAKKCLSAISQEHPALSLFGVNCGVSDLTIKPELLPYIEGRRVIIAFDRDGKPETRHKVFKAIKRLASAITYHAKGEVAIASWNANDGKGLDDLIANDPQLFHTAIETAKSFDKWRLENCEKRWEELHTLSTKPNIFQEFLDDIPIFIKGQGHAINVSMGGGKTTTSMKESMTKFLDKGLYAPSYRNSLAYNTCGAVERLYEDLKKTIHFEKEPKLNHIHNISHPSLLQPTEWVTGCIESFLKMVEGKTDNEIHEYFSHQNIFIDEIDTWLKHLLFSTTLNDLTRFTIIEKLKIALKACYSFVYASSNLSDWCVNILEKWSGKPQKVTHNGYSKISANLRILEGTIEGEKLKKHDHFPFLLEMLSLECFAVFSDSQVYTESLEEWLIYHGKKNIIRIDSKTTPKDEIKEIIKHIDEYLKNHPNTILLFTSSAESGLDISIPNYFQKLYGFYFGIIEINSFCQGMGRIRDQSVERAAWIRTFSIAEPEDLTQFTGEALSYSHRHQLEIEGYLMGSEFVENFAAIQLKILETLKDETALAYDLMAARNYEKAFLRELTINQLKKEGYNVKLETIDRTDAHKETKKEFGAKKGEVIAQNVRDIANASVEYIGKPAAMLTNDATWEERCAIKKAKLVDRLPDFWGDEYTDGDDNPVRIYDQLDQNAVELFEYTESRLLKGLELLQLVKNPEQAKLITQGRYAKILESSNIIPWKVKTLFLTVKGLSWANVSGLVDALFKGDLTLDSPEIQELIPKMNASSRFRAGKDGLVTLQKALGKKPHKNPLQYAQYLIGKVGIPTTLKGNEDHPSLSLSKKRWEGIQPYFEDVQNAIATRFERICTHIKSGDLLQILDTKKVYHSKSLEPIQHKGLDQEKNQSILIKKDQKITPNLYPKNPDNRNRLHAPQKDQKTPLIKTLEGGVAAKFENSWHNYSLGQRVLLWREVDGVGTWNEAVIDKVLPNLIHAHAVNGYFGDYIEPRTLGLIAPMKGERVCA